MPLSLDRKRPIFFVVVCIQAILGLVVDVDLVDVPFLSHVYVLKTVARS